MYTIDETQIMLEKAAARIPEAFFDGLNGGVCLLEETRLHDKSRPDRPMYILGEYRREAHLGSFINIYYGSFIKVHGHLPAEAFEEALFLTLRHELRHHLEYRAGERTLLADDEKRLRQYLSGQIPDEPIG
jgi:hypothetical protein